VTISFIVKRVYTKAFERVNFMGEGYFICSLFRGGGFANKTPLALRGKKAMTG
jgi:hypothetical protein